MKYIVGDIDNYGSGTNQDLILVFPVGMFQLIMEDLGKKANTQAAFVSITLKVITLDQLEQVSSKPPKQNSCMGMNQNL